MMMMNKIGDAGSGRIDVDTKTLLQRARKKYRRGKTDEAAADLREILRRSPGHAEALHGAGAVAWRTGNFPKAEALFRKALASYSRQPHARGSLVAKAHYNLGLLLLAQGKFREGWDHIKWRIEFANAYFMEKIPTKPLWDGSDARNRNLLLQAEGGFGDTLQFVRYAKILARKNPSLMLLCHPPLARLFRISGGLGRVIPEGALLPSFDIYCPLFSLPGIFSTTLTNIPANIPYLKARPSEVKSWRKIFSSPGMNVGLVWAGNPRAQIDLKRSMTLRELAPLLDLKGVNFFSLQVGRVAVQRSQPDYSVRITDLSPFIRDFADTAAILCALDLLISVDTAAAHLAGALGRPVWVMLPRVADWRWLLAREDSPWYPTMKLFRQTRFDDWSHVVERIKRELRQLIKKR
jgi:tetratricopeptide (TPR) repeat protein